MNVLCGVQFGTVHAGPFFILPKAPVISHEKDWGLVPPAVVKALNAERPNVTRGGKQRLFALGNQLS